MKKLWLITLLLLVIASIATAAPIVRGTPDDVDIKATDVHGVPTFVTGRLGTLGAGTPAAASKAFLKANGALFHAAGTEDFDVMSADTDSLGLTHVKMQQMLHGLPVVGAEMIVHSDSGRNVYAMNGAFAPDVNVPRSAKIAGRAALLRAASQAGITNWTALNTPSLTYVVNEKGTLHLAWVARASYTNASGPQIDKIYADALTGDLVLTAPEYKYARNRQTYTANNTTTLPGTLKYSETSTVSGTDYALNDAHNYAGSVYNYYKNVFNRDSYDNAGATIKSSVHYSTSYNNAFWNGSQMVYGDGDGTTFIALSRALDVDAHELSHAVTERTANLTYSNEPGALNEATSDILGNSCEAYTKNGGTPNSNTWLVGEDIYTPGTAGDALRSMADPALYGDYDYYPTRYTGTSDNGGVHSNSGIANLAYKLMVTGGSHPRSKTTVVVPALSSTASTSLDMAQRIWYRALTVYMTSSTNFQGARNATAQAAADLYGGTTGAAYNSVQKAWDCVGAPGGTSGGGSTVTSLSNGVAVSFSVATGAWANYKITVPSGQTSLSIVMSGGTGDADLYVKFGSQPTLSSYTYRPYLTGNNETVTVTNPSAGDWYISAYGYSAASGVSLKATYSTSGGSTCTSYSGSLSGTGANYYAPSTSGYTSSVSGTHTAKLTGPASGADFDLYLQKYNGTSWAQVAASESATANESISYSGTSGSYRWRVYSYSGSGSFTLCTTKP